VAAKGGDGASEGAAPASDVAADDSPGAKGVGAVPVEAGTDIVIVVVEESEMVVTALPSLSDAAGLEAAAAEAVAEAGDDAPAGAVIAAVDANPSI